MRSKIRRYYIKFKIAILHLLIRYRKTLKDDITNIVIIAPHPDDEIFGLGGFLTKMKEKNIKIYLIYLTDGEASIPNRPETASMRISLSKTVLNRLDINERNIFRLHFLDSKLPTPDSKYFNEIVNTLKLILEKIKFTEVFVTHPGDLWPYDHVSAFTITKQVLIDLKFTGNFYGYWVWLCYNFPLSGLVSFDWSKTEKIKIKPYQNVKRELIDIYMKSFSPEGIPYSGTLPKEFLSSFNFPYEIVTKFQL
jgi:LmbE family N-acetylglucosaminyl deacetylase